MLEGAAMVRMFVRDATCPDHLTRMRSPLAIESLRHCCCTACALSPLAARARRLADPSH